jgi:hypothetical protein
VAVRPNSCAVDHRSETVEMVLVLMEEVAATTEGALLKMRLRIMVGVMVGGYYFWGGGW